MNQIVMSSAASPAIIIVQQETLKDEFLANRSISRLGWISLILGVGAFLLHYLSIDQLANISPINGGLISGLFLIIAGLMSIQVGYRETSVQHARWCSFVASLVFAPGLIVVSLVALVLESEEFTPQCPKKLRSSAAMLFGNSFEVLAADIPCAKATKLTDLTQMVNIMQLMIGIAAFFTHVALLSMQGKVLERLNNNEKFHLNGTMVLTPVDETMLPADPPPKYEDLPPPTQSSAR